MSKKVLITYATGGMGHLTAARAIEEALRTKYPLLEVKNVDVLNYSPRLYRETFSKGYDYLSAKYPQLWGWLYQAFNHKPRQKVLTLISQLAAEEKFVSFIKEFQPDFIISAHPLPMVLISASKRREVIDILSSMVVTDFGCHSYWIDQEVNYYFVAAKEVGQCLENYGVRADKIVVTGIPIGLKFSRPLDKNKLIKKIGLNPRLFTLLIVGGQFSFTALKKVVGGIKKENQNVQFLVVAGRDKKLEEALLNLNLGQDRRIKVFGFVDNLHELMTASDLIFSKAGGLTASECLAKGLPMIINKVIPGQEEDNVNYLTKQGAAVKVANFGEIIKVVSKLLSQPQKIAAMKQVCRKIGKPNAAINLADFVYKKIK